MYGLAHFSHNATNRYTPKPPLSVEAYPGYGQYPSFFGAGASSVPQGVLTLNNVLAPTPGIAGQALVSQGFCGARRARV